MTLLAAFDALLARWSGQDDLCIGTPTGGRPRLDLEAVAGFFVNTLVLRVRADASLTFRELLAAVREECLGAYAHQEPSPSSAWSRSSTPIAIRAGRRSSQVMFSLRSAPAAARPPPGAPAAVPRRGVGVTASAAKFDLTLAMEGGAGGLAGGMEPRDRPLRKVHRRADALGASGGCSAPSWSTPPPASAQLPLLGDTGRDATGPRRRSPTRSPSNTGAIGSFTRCSPTRRRSRRTPRP